MKLNNQFNIVWKINGAFKHNLSSHVLNYPRKSTTSNTRTTGNTQVGIECVTWKLTSWRSESRLIHTRSRLLQSAGRSHTPGQWSPGKSETGRLYWPITKRRPGLEMKRGVPKTGEVVYYKFHVYILINKERIISRNFLA